MQPKNLIWLADTERFPTAVKYNSISHCYYIIMHTYICLQPLYLMWIYDILMTAVICIGIITVIASYFIATVHLQTEIIYYTTLCLYYYYSYYYITCSCPEVNSHLYAVYCTYNILCKSTGARTYNTWHTGCCTKMQLNRIKIIYISNIQPARNLNVPTILFRL